MPDNYLNNENKDNDKKGNEECESIRRLHASIEQEGVLTPLLVRPSKKDKDTFEILSGYRRKKVCEILAESQPQFRKVPVIIIECDDDEASEIITSANVQRQKVSLLDKIISCGRMYHAMKHRGSGKNKDLTAIIVANIFGMTRRTVERYSSLFGIPDFMLQLIGRKVKTQDGELRLSIRAGEFLNRIKQEKLDMINQIMQKNDNIVITEKTAKDLKNVCKGNPKITIEELERMILEAASSKEEVPSVKKRRFSPGSDLTEAIDVYCHDMSDQQVEELLCGLLKQWREAANTAGANANVTTDTADTSASTDTATMIENAGVESSGAENVN